MRDGSFKKHLFFLQLTSLLMVTVLACVFLAAKVSAADPCTGVFPTYTGGRCPEKGYYTNADIGLYLSSGWTWNGHRSFDPEPINNATDFENIVHDDLFNRGNYGRCQDENSFNGCTLNRETLVGTSFMVNMMLGKKGADFGGSQQNGITYARNNYNLWKTRVDAYDAAGLVDFSVKNYRLPSGRADSVTVNFGKDNAFYVANDNEVTEVIVFKNSDGSGSPIFQINKLCGNVFGKPQALQDLSYDFSLGATSSTQLNDEEAPTSVTFKNTVTTISSGAGGVTEVNPTATQSYYVLHSDGTKSQIPGVPLTTSDNTARHFGPTGSSFSAAPYTSTYSISPGILSATDKICTTITVSVGKGKTNATGDITTSSGSISSNSACDGIVAKPYMQVYGGDVGVGGGVAAVDPSGVLICDPNSSNLDGYSLLDGSAGVVGWNKDDKDPSALWAGAGSQYGVRAMGGIYEFASNYNLTTSGVGRPVSLSFANATIDTHGGKFGGAYAATPSGCDSKLMTPSDYANAITGPINISDKLTDAITTSTTLFVKGNVYINQSEIYTNSGNYQDIRKIPSLKVVALGGNIYIQGSATGNVTQLDGTYYAIPSTTGVGGVIYTCAYGSTPYTGTDNYQYCGNQLVVNGSFVARQVQFLRSSGSLRLSTTDTDIYTPNSSLNHSGEIFNYDPEVWINSGYTGVSTDYESAATLPPVL